MLNLLHLEGSVWMNPVKRLKWSKIAGTNRFARKEAEDHVRGNNLLQRFSRGSSDRPSVLLQHLLWKNVCLVLKDMSARKRGSQLWRI